LLTIVGKEKERHLQRASTALSPRKKHLLQWNPTFFAIHSLPLGILFVTLHEFYIK